MERSVSEAQGLSIPVWHTMLVTELVNCQAAAVTTRNAARGDDFLCAPDLFLPRIPYG